VANLLGSAGLPQDVVDRIVVAAEGNPLYVEQMLSMLIDSQALRREGDQWVRTAGYGEITVPPTIKALLEARLDNLARADRATVEPASVIGLEFARPAIEALAPDALRPEIGQHLDMLAHKHFIDLSSSSQAETVYRFHHHLVRDTVYNGLLKRARANLHLAFVRWADKVNADRDRALEFEEILGYHLEQAHRYLSELGSLDEAGVAVGKDASSRLASAAKRAFARGDMHAAANLFRRAAAILGENEPVRLALLPEFGEVLLELGDFTQARTVLTEAQAAADRAANWRIATSAQLLKVRVRLFSAEPGDYSEEALRLAHSAIPLFEHEDAHQELARAWRLIGLIHGIAARYGQSTDAVTRSIAHARLAGDERLIARNAQGLASSTLLGPTPVPQALELCQDPLLPGAIARDEWRVRPGTNPVSTRPRSASRARSRFERGLNRNRHTSCRTAGRRPRHRRARSLARL
jgi:predicted ATPase